MKKILRNTLFLSASQIISRTIGLLYTIFLARALGVENFGIYIFTLTFVYNFILVADFGLERLVLRDLPRHPEKTQFYFERFLPLRMVLAVFAYFLLLLLGLVLRQPPREIFYLAILGLTLLPYNFTNLMTSFQNAKEKMEYMALANIGAIVLTTLFGLSFIFLKLSLFWIFVAYLSGNLVLSLVFLVKSSALGLSLGWVCDLDFWRKSLKQSWVLAVLTIFSVFYLRISVILIGLLGGAYLTGIYGSAFRFIEALILIPQSLALALFPLSSRLFAQDKEKLKRVYKKGLGVLFLASLPFASALVFLPKFIVFLTYGPKYQASASVFPILGLASVLLFVNALPGTIVQNSSKVKQFLPLVLLYFLVEVVLCLILIPSYSILGAAWAVVGAELVGLVLNNVFVWRILRSES